MDKCDSYQRIRNYIKTLVGKLIASKILEKLQIYLIVDFITNLLLVVEKSVILIVYNRLFKMVYFVVTIERKFIRLVRNNMWKLCRFLESVISDSVVATTKHKALRLWFVIKLTKELNKILKIETKLLIVFHPQTDVKIKQIN